MKTEAPFQLDFTLEGKAAVTEHDGALYIEGYASDFGIDRENEVFENGAFTKGMKAFMETNPVLLYHHKYDQALGQIESFEHRPAGLWVKARVDEAEPGTNLADVVRKIRTGTIRGFSVGGFFKRRRGADGQPRIHTADIAEISVTPFPVNPRTLFAVSQKAFGENDAATDELIERIGKLGKTLDDLDAKAVSAAKRAASKKAGHTLPDGSFPIDTCSDVSKAVKLAGNGKNPAAARAHTISRAKALGCSNLIPDTWK